MLGGSSFKKKKLGGFVQFPRLLPYSSRLPAGLALFHPQWDRVRTDSLGKMAFLLFSFFRKKRGEGELRERRRFTFFP